MGPVSFQLLFISPSLEKREKGKREKEREGVGEREKRETDSYLISLWPLGIKGFEVQIILMIFWFVLYLELEKIRKLDS